MTLEQAYEQMRKELRSLRCENRKLKENTYIDADRAAHEKEIRRLTSDNKDLRKLVDRYHDLWRHALNSHHHQFEDLLRIDELEKEKASLLAQIQDLTTALQEAENTVAKLKLQMNHDHENSSIPSSAKPFHKKIANSRINTGKKPGAQKGHPGHKRPCMEPTLPVIELTPDPTIIDNPDYYPTGRFISKQLADIHVSVSVTEYRAQIFRNRVTGARYHAPFPKGLTNEFNYGPNSKALAFLLNNYCNVSIDKTRELLQEITDGRILLSKGLINSLSHKFSAATAADRKHIYDMLLLAPSMNTDFTPVRVNCNRFIK